MINIGQAYFLTDEEFATEVSDRKARLGLATGETVLGCMVCGFDELPALSNANNNDN